MGRGRNNVVHIGDWLIDQFPLALSVNGEPFGHRRRLGASDLALDRAILYAFSSTSRSTRLCRRPSCVRLTSAEPCGLCRDAGAATRASRLVSFAAC